MALDAGNPKRVLWSRHAPKTDMTSISTSKLVAAEGGTFALESASEGNQQTFNATNGHTLSGSPRTADVHPGPRVQFDLQDGQLVAKRLDSSNAGPVWHFMPMDGERIIGLIPRPVNDPVASIGKVLGDRRVLYKYLNPNLALLATANVAKKSASFYVLDTIFRLYTEL